LPGQRDWVKVKRRRTVDCVVIGIAGDHTHPRLVLGLRHADGQLHHLGRLVGVICHLERKRHRRLIRANPFALADGADYLCLIKPYQMIDSAYEASASATMRR
jgi:hypothetical protein